MEIAMGVLDSATGLGLLKGKMPSNPDCFSSNPARHPLREDGGAAWAVWISSVGFLAGRALNLHAEDTVGYRFSDYQEENGRVKVETHAANFSVSATPKLTVRGTVVYDAISGATPTGAPPPDGSSQVPLVEIKDVRRAFSLAAGWQEGRFLTTPQVSYSKERDYESTGLALNESIDFNQKNTTLNLGLAHDFDRVLPNRGAWIRNAREKDDTEGLLGIVQLIDPATFISANLTLGYGSGFLTDAYKRVVFPEFSPDILLPEKRPGYRFRQVFYTGITRFIARVDAATELSYRFHHDSYDIFSHTVQWEWRQKLGKRITLSPSVRFYEQSAASFYAPTISGDPRPDEGAPIPQYYSSDFRLSRMRTWTFGLSANIQLIDACTLDFGYQRYEMLGLDGVTAASAYPKANVFSAGLHLTF
jgi:hypothetical protein